MSSPKKNDLLKFRCPECDDQLTVPIAMAGKLGACPTCAILVTAPELIFAVESPEPDELPAKAPDKSPAREPGTTRKKRKKPSLANPPKEINPEDRKAKSFRPVKKSSLVNEPTKMRPLSHSSSAPISGEIRKVDGMEDILRVPFSDEVGEIKYGHKWESVKSTDAAEKTKIEPKTLIIGSTILTAIIISLIIWLSPDDQLNPGSASSGPEGNAVKPEVPLFGLIPFEIADAFIKETDPTRRLLYVRNPELIARRLHEFPAQALRESTEDLLEIPIIHDEEFSYARFAARFPNGDMRLLAVVTTPEGPKVDWDCFARSTSAPWEDILNGLASNTEVRVFVEKSNYYNFDFKDQEKWSSYALTSPDLEEVLYAYVLRNSERDHLMTDSIDQTDINRSSTRMTLLLSADLNQAKRRQFQVKQVLGLGWVKPDQSPELTWKPPLKTTP
jgi:hypothetical protein